MDDNLGTASNPIEAKKRLMEIQEIFRTAGMVAHKFACNNHTVLEDYEEDKVAKLVTIGNEEEKQRQSVLHGCSGVEGRAVTVPAPLRQSSTRRACPTR